MKRLTVFVAVILLLGTLTLSVSAAGEGIHMTNVEANPGDIVRITVSLQEPLQGNAMGITYTFDKTRLKALPEQSGWSRKGVLQDFSSHNHDGVWAVGDAVDLKGDVCVLVFQVLENASFTETEITCTLTIKNGDKTTGCYQTSASVTEHCSHSFGEWADSGELGHSRSCSLCSATQTQSHDWKEGVLTKDPDDPGKGTKTNTCTVCGASRTETVAIHNPQVYPSDPAQGRQEEVVTVPTEARPQPTYPADKEQTLKDETPKPAESQKSESTEASQSAPQQNPNEQPSGYTPKDYNRAPEETAAVTSPDSVKAPGTASSNTPQGDPDPIVRETAPLAVPIEGWTGEAETPDSHPHDHDAHETAGGGVVVFAALAAVIAAAAGVWLYRKRKHR